MILRIKEQDDLFSALDKFGFKTSIEEKGSVLIKINLARPPEPSHPRSSPFLLSQLIRYVTAYSSSCAIVESADGYLSENLKSIGLMETIETYHVKLIDLDLEKEVECKRIEDENHYLPKCLKEYGVRIALPAMSKRPQMIFSNNVKLFVGIVPRRMYQIGEPLSWRPRVHLDLHKSVANIYRVVQGYAPFDFYVNGGLAMDERRGEFVCPDIWIGNDAVELDHAVLHEVFQLEPPEYMLRLLGEL